MPISSYPLPRREFFKLTAAGAALVAGCNGDSRRPATEDDVKATDGNRPPIRVAVVDDAALAASIEQQWSIRGEGPLSVVRVTAEELLGSSTPPDGDALIYPPGLMGELVQRGWLSPVDSRWQQDENLAWRDLFNLIRLREITWGGTALAIPLGSPQLVLLYRGDVWAEHQLPIPRTWTEYQEVLETLRGLYPPQDTSQPRVACEPLASGWGSQMLMARTAAYAQFRGTLAIWFDLQSMRPQLESPPMVRALRELIQATQETDGLEADPQAALAAFLTGRALTAVTWPTPALSLPEETKAIPSDAIRVTELPGAREGYQRSRESWEPRDEQDDGWRVPLLCISGRQASVLRRSPQPSSTANLLSWMAGKEFSADIVTASPATTMFREQHTQLPRLWVPDLFSDQAARDYTDAVLATMGRRGAVESVRIPGRDQYLSALDAAVAAAVRGELSAEAGLQQAAGQWEAITDQLGRADQSEAYRRSLNL